MYIPGVLVVSKRNKPRMPQVIIGRPFRELELAHKHRPQPSTLFHLGRC